MVLDILFQCAFSSGGAPRTFFCFTFNKVPFHFDWHNNVTSAWEPNSPDESPSVFLLHNPSPIYEVWNAASPRQ